ncbi:MAG: hypothetical protein CMF59_14340 [Leptospiraceae bacterium]|nr:hypothetical protein [Leptospiraceae bacterium]
MDAKSLAIGLMLFLCPAALIYLSSRFEVLKKIGVVILCYVVGAILGNSGFTSSETLPIQKGLAEGTVALALPMLLFSMDVPSVFRLAGKSLLAMLLAGLSVVAVATLLYFALHGLTAQGDELAAMAVAVYTGGTPNLASVKTALSIPDDLYIKFHTYDTLMGLFYLLFLFSFAKPVFGRVLKPFKSDSRSSNAQASDASLSSNDASESQTEKGKKREEVSREISSSQNQEIAQEYESENRTVGVEDYGSLIFPRVWPPLLAALLLSAGIVGLSAFLGSLFSENAAPAITILSITSLGIAASFVPQIRNIRKTFSVGMYIILVFCVSVASLTDVAGLLNIDPAVIVFIVGAVVGSLLLHSLLCRWAGVDVDTFLVISSSAICSPPFVPVVASAIKNRQLIVPGLTTGILGYGIGNYLGISIAYALRALAGSS